jgi:recombination protein RecT
MSDNGSIAKREDRPIDIFKDQLQKAQPMIAAVLPKHMTPERILKIATAAVSRSPLLLQCSANSIVQAVVISSQLGLEPGGPLGHAALVPFKNNKTQKYEAQFIPMYRGLIDLARRSGNVLSVESHCVYEKDRWRFKRTAEKTELEHEPYLDGDRGKMKLVYSIIRLKDTPLPQIDVMTVADVDKIKGRSRAANSGPWVTDYDEMARKTVTRRNLKYAPMSVELASALTIEDRAEVGEPDFSDIDYGSAELVEEAESVSQADEIKAKILKPEPAPVAETEPHAETADRERRELGAAEKEVIDGIRANLNKIGADVAKRSAAMLEWTNKRDNGIVSLESRCSGCSERASLKMLAEVLKASEKQEGELL